MFYSYRWYITFLKKRLSFKWGTNRFRFAYSFRMYVSPNGNMNEKNYISNFGTNRFRFIYSFQMWTTQFMSLMLRKTNFSSVLLGACSWTRQSVRNPIVINSDLNIATIYIDGWCRVPYIVSRSCPSLVFRYLFRYNLETKCIWKLIGKLNIFMIN